MRLFRWILFYSVLIALVLGTGFAGMIYGYRANLRSIFPHEILGKFNWKFEELARTYLSPPEEGVPDNPLIPSHLLLLETSQQEVKTGLVWTAEDPVPRNGGGLTSFGDDLLLLPYSGQIWAVTGDDPVRPTEIYAPENNRAAYIETINDPAFAEYSFEQGYLRYNDLKYFNTGAAQGLLASYTAFYPDETCYANEIARLDIPEGTGSIDEISASKDDWTVIYRSEPCLPFKTEHTALEGHLAGGKLAFVPPSTVYLSAGDYHFDGMRARSYPLLAQDPEAEYGKLMRIDLETEESQIVSMGHRNPQGLTVMPDGRIFMVEHGPRGGDELNQVVEGQNYGWPLNSYGTAYKGAGPLATALSFARHDDFAAPTYSWVPSIATTDVEYVENFHPLWDGDLIVASLIDLSLHRVRLEDDRVVYSERIPVGKRLRDVHIHSDGRLAVWADSNELFLFTPRLYPSLDAILDEYVAERGIEPAVATRLSENLEICAECHSFQPNDHEKAPGLARIFGAPIGKTAYEGYSDGLAAHDGTWTREALAAFLADPEGFAPGALMPAAGFESDAERDAFLDFLEYLANSF